MITTQSTSLKKVASVFNGKTPSKAEQRNTGHPVLKIKDVDVYGRFIGQYDSFVEDDVIKKNTGKLLLGNETLILNAAHNADYVGTKVFFSEPDVKGALPTGEWLVVRANKDVLDAKFVHYWIQSDRVRKKIRGLVKGIHLYPKDVAELEINLPPLDEQKRIAGILDKADAVRRKRAESLKLLDELLRATFLDMFGDLLTNNRNWKTGKISAVCETIVDCVNRTAPIVDYETPYKMIRTTNVRNGKVSLKSTRFVEEEVFHRWNRRLYPQQGDVILTREAPVGEVGIINSSDKVFLGQRLMLYRANKALMTPNFLLHQFQSKYLQHQYDKGGMGSTVKHLPLPTCKSFQVRMPPIELQQKFDLICLRADDYSQKIEECSSESDTLFHSLVARAFKGDL
jgi:type I restriction enzyme, S subunit